MIDDKRLDEIEKRAREATSGPWIWKQVKGMGADNFLYSKTDRTYGEYVYIANGMSGFANCEFIAHAREDVPELVAEVRRLREELSRKIDATCPVCGKPAGHEHGMFA